MFIITTCSRILLPKHKTPAMASILQHLQELSFPSDALQISCKILNEPALMDDLVTLYHNGPSRLSQRAAGVICLCAKKNPDLILPHLAPMLQKLKEPGLRDAKKRNTIRILQYVKIPEELEGEVMEICFGYLASNEAVAIKVFSMQVLFDLSAKYPELRNELRILIEDQVPYEKAAFVSRGSKILKKLKESPGAPPY